MLKTFLLVFYIFLQSTHCLSQDLQNSCQRNPIFRVKYGFSLKGVTLLGFEMDSKVIAFKIKGLKFENQKLMSDSVNDCIEFKFLADISLNCLVIC
jgi:hypothetical protein